MKVYIKGNVVVFERVAPDPVFNKAVVELLKEPGTNLSVSKEKIVVTTKK